MRTGVQREQGDGGEWATVPMEPIESDRRGPAQAKALLPPRAVLRIFYSCVAIVALLAGFLASTAMHFGLFDQLFPAVRQHVVRHELMYPAHRNQPLAPQLLAQDAFSRPNQTFWGSAPGDLPWQGDANRTQAFAIEGKAGIVLGGSGFFTAILGPRIANEDVQASAALSHFQAEFYNFGVVLRFSDADHYYKAYLDGTHLVLFKRANGRGTTLAALPFAALDGVSYSLRFQATGPLLQVRAWPTAAREPTTWMEQLDDASLTLGEGGMRMLLEPGITLTVNTFRELSEAGQKS